MKAVKGIALQGRSGPCTWQPRKPYRMLPQAIQGCLMHCALTLSITLFVCIALARFFVCLRLDNLILQLASIAIAVALSGAGSSHWMED
eukprot:3647017-Alexandrium_andersonii.AAC.1